MSCSEHALGVSSNPLILWPEAITVSCTTARTRLLAPCLHTFQGSTKTNYGKLISANHKMMFICGRKRELLKSSEGLNVNNKSSTVDYAPRY